MNGTTASTPKNRRGARALGAVDVMACPPAILLAGAAVAGEPVQIGGQDCHAEPGPSPAVCRPKCSGMPAPSPSSSEAHVPPGNRRRCGGEGTGGTPRRLLGFLHLCGAILLNLGATGTIDTSERSRSSDAGT